MSAVTIQQMADRVAALMDERLGIPGKTLKDKLRKGGRRLPRKVRARAAALAQAADLARNPKLLVQIDEGQVAEDYDACLQYLNQINPWARRKGAAANLALSILGSLMIFAVMLASFLYWRGYL